MKKYIFLLITSIGLGVCTTSSSHAVLSIDITRGNIDPLPIAVPVLKNEDGTPHPLGEQVTGVIEADLERSGLFRSINKRAFIQDIVNNATVPLFADWRQVNAYALVTGDLRYGANNGLSASFRLWDIFSEQQIAGKSYTTQAANWRRISHLVADEIYTRLTGEKGYFDTRIVYISEDGPAKHRTKRLAIMDQDGANHQYLTGGRDLVLTPRFSHNLQRIIYLSYADKLPRVHMYDALSRKTWIVGDFPGMSFAPRFSPDDKSIVMAVSLEGNSEIFHYDLAGRHKTRLTFDPAIDVSPSYSPDSQSIVFNSDRGGSQQLYVMDSNGKNVKRISFGNGKYGSPEWSPRGDYIAFTKIYNGNFYIGVMHPDGSGERLLTESFLDESPTWAPNGRVLMFTRQTPSYYGKASTSNIYSIDLTGYNERLVPTPKEASDPAWSPLL